ncbi:MAG: hypothetical protein GC165_19335 [Armatimonadetes bacterium]|nr:hypothetical protein [Armatimonadota bacterium]
MKIGGRRLIPVFSIAIWLLVLPELAFALSIQDIQKQIALAQDNSSQIIGEATVTTKYFSVQAPKLSDPVGQGIAFEGSYRWLLNGSNWIVEKQVRETKPGVEPGTRLLINEPHDGSVLKYEMFKTDKGHQSFLTGFLDERWDVAYASGAIGRVWVRGTIEKHLDEIDSPVVSDRGESIEVTGKYRGEDITITLLRSKGMLASAIELREKNVRSGYHINEFIRISGVWVAKSANIWSGVFNGSQLAEGTASEVDLVNVRPYSGNDWPSDVPKMPVSATIGSDDGRLYKVAANGDLVYWGEAGHKGGGKSSLALGNIFVLSGSGLLLACLWKVVFRRRKDH